MTDMYGPTPEEMKVGETYKVVEDKEHGGIRLEKVESEDSGSKEEELFDIEFQLSPIRFYIANIQAFKAGMTFDRWICHTIEELLDQIYKDGPAKY
jgi:hypothetical protein